MRSGSEIRKNHPHTHSEKYSHAWPTWHERVHVYVCVCVWRGNLAPRLVCVRGSMKNIMSENIKGGASSHVHVAAAAVASLWFHCAMYTCTSLWVCVTAVRAVWAAIRKYIAVFAHAKANTAIPMCSRPCAGGLMRYVRYVIHVYERSAHSSQ